MNIRSSLTALALGLMAGSAFAATPAPTAKPAPAPAVQKKHVAAPAKCKSGETLVNGKCRAASSK